MHDDLQRDLLKASWKMGGSANGHNGIKSIIECFGKDFWRVRVGIGRPPSREPSIVTKYVLGNFTREEQRHLDGGFVDDVCNDIERYVCDINEAT